MELKLLDLKNIDTSGIALNRTRLELKPWNSFLQNIQDAALNRTRLELKHKEFLKKARQKKTLNRTRLELKLKELFDLFLLHSRLIAPDWN